jgi:CelD/BcsL family acetyltransferase involved in cellulose biosynthesis
MATGSKKYDVSVESFESVASHWRNSASALRWNCLFVLPDWLKTWWSAFGGLSQIYLCAVRQAEKVVGIAPLLVDEGQASFIGDAEVCDYQDFIITPGRDREFFNVLLDDLSRQGVAGLHLKPLRPDSTVLTTLADVAAGRGCEVDCSPLDVTVELKLPASWDEYLHMLNAKQRHEVKRKLRRLQEAGRINYRVVEDVKDLKTEMESFLALFGSNREDKAVFMTDRMALFFRSMAEAMAAENMLKLYFLDFNEIPAAAVMCFDYQSTVYLYNNGYNDRFSSLSVGLLCTVFSIKDSIGGGKKKYDFLKGAETYKYRLAGKEVPLYQCKIKLE